MTRVLATLAVIVVAALAAFACDNDATYSADLGPDAPACTVQAPTDAVDACTRFRDALCAQAIHCAMFADTAACEAWFTPNYGDCSKATKGVDEAKQSAWIQCVCTLPHASCRSLEEGGAEVSVPACGQF